MNPIYYYKIKPIKNQKHKLRRKSLSNKEDIKDQEPIKPLNIDSELSKILSLKQALEREFHHLHQQDIHQNNQQQKQDLKWNDNQDNLYHLSFIKNSNQSSNSTQNLVVVDASTSDSQSFIATNFNFNNTMWPYQSYKPISWDKYYAQDIEDKHVSITSGLAAGITIGVFFAVFLLTFGCRLYSQRIESNRQRHGLSARRRLSVSDLLGWPISPCRPPPPYEVAITLPLPHANSPASPPPFMIGERCLSAAPSYDDSSSSITDNNNRQNVPTETITNLERTPAFSPVYTV